jgi:parallel beta-helix repeat protein
MNSTGVIGLSALLGSAILNVSAGDLDPQGSPGPTPGPEPRTPITALPVIIGEPGSYLVTQNLILSSTTGEHGITIIADDVTLDLGGFSLTATSASSGDGIHVARFLSGVTVLNGTLRGWGEDGLDMEDTRGTRIRGILSQDNGVNGIVAGNASTVSDCVAYSNGNNGVRTGEGCTVRDTVVRFNTGNNMFLLSNSTAERCVAEFSRSSGGIATLDSCVLTACVSHGNDSAGFNVGFSCTLDGCTAADNDGSGFFSQASCTFTGCTSENNMGNGISTSGDCVVTNCVSRSNDLVGIRAGGGTLVRHSEATFNSGDGINAFSNCVLLENRVAGNGQGDSDGVGIRLRSGCRVEGNMVNRNDAGIVQFDSSSEDNLVIRNFARDNTPGLAYNVSTATNRVGTIITGSGTLTSTNSWANFSF